MTRLTSAYRFMIVLLAFSAYAATFKVGFLWDDHAMIEVNPTLRSWSMKNLQKDFSTDVFSGMGDPYYRPLQTVLNRLDYSLWGLRSWGYHLTNFLFHALNGLLVVELVLALGFPPLAALLTACLFVVHPIVVEQLLIISGRAELIGLSFALVTTLLWPGDFLPLSRRCSPKRVL
jgi:hypothetical protein